VLLRVRTPKLAVLCFVIGINVITIWSQTKTQPEPTVPSLYDNPPDANPRYFPKGIFGQKFSQFTTL
jgi:hypothetical protein